MRARVKSAAAALLLGSQLLVAPAGASDWGVVNVPDPPPERTANHVYGVACVAAADCWSVGSYSDGRVDQTLVERWDGHAWSVVPSPNRITAGEGNPMPNYLYGVACAPGASCWAVGYAFSEEGYETLIQRWNGNAWSIVPSPNATGAEADVLRAVSCASATDCWAVGYSTVAGVDRTLVLRWDGTAWTVVESPNVGGGRNALWGVTCISSASCWAVGFYDAATGNGQTLIERWDGTAWTVAASPNTLPTQNNQLFGVSCAAASECWAVGYYDSAAASQTLVQRWDGSTWSIVASPNSLPTQPNYLTAVACAGAGDCWAAGSYLEDRTPIPHSQTVILRWNGSAWGTAASGNVADEHNALHAVACASGACWAVGNHVTEQAEQTLMQRAVGAAWEIVTSPNRGAIRDNFLYGASCVAADDCWAVGYYSNPAYPARSLVAHWDGAEWHLVDSPNPGERNAFLLGVDCVSATECWAVGYAFFTGGIRQTLTQRWDGTGWAIVASPNTSGSEDNHLQSVTCVAPGDCWAVGHVLVSQVTGYVDQTLILHWDGNAWSRVTSPNTLLGGGDYLKGVDCASATDCWAVGYALVDGVYQALALRWNGLVWSGVAAPSTSATRHNLLRAVACAEPSSCWAVGSAHNGATEQTLIERWDGSAWQIVPSPNTGAASKNVLNAVTCSSASSCFAAGTGFTPWTDKALIARWDGSAWALATLPPARTSEYGFLHGVTCATASDCWAVGFSGFGDTLALHSPPLAPPNRPPVAALTASAAGGVAPLEVTFDASASSDPDEGDALVAYAYDFGDGTSELAQDARAVVHTYRSAGTYVASLTVNDRSGASASPATVTIVVTAPDEIPDAFVFVERTGVATGAYVTSEAQTLAGFGSAPISVANGQYSLDGGAYTSGAGTVAAGQTLRVRHVSASSGGASVETAIAVGGYGTTFRSTTSTVDRTPDVFGFVTQAGVPPATEIASNVVTPAGYDAPVAVQAGPGCAYRINGGAWTGASGSINPGDSLQVKHTSSSKGLTYTKTYVKVGGVTGYFTTRTQ